MLSSCVLQSEEGFGNERDKPRGCPLSSAASACVQGAVTYIQTGTLLVSSGSRPLQKINKRGYLPFHSGAATIKLTGCICTPGEIGRIRGLERGMLLPP